MMEKLNKKFRKTKIRSYGHELQIFMIIKYLRKTFNCNSFAVILVGFVLKKDENYYPQVFLKECKYIEKERK